MQMKEDAPHEARFIGKLELVENWFELPNSSFSGGELLEDNLLGKALLEGELLEEDLQVQLNSKLFGIKTATALAAFYQKNSRPSEDCHPDRYLRSLAWRTM